MDFEQLQIKYQELLEENTQLKSEIASLKKQSLTSENSQQTIPCEGQQLTILDASEFPNAVEPNKTPHYSISDNKGKVQLFMSLFKGRDDVYAKRWESKAGKSGYSPHCSNEWKSGVCKKPRIKCSECSYKDYVPLSETVVEVHLRGELVAGIYPMLKDESCYFLTIDFDEADWSKDVSAIRTICSELDIPIAVERSRSGNGAHIWVFFETAVSASLARKLGSAILTHAMNQRHEIAFTSYDRLFPNQDTMPKGGFGNLIALPLQATPRESGNSVFIDEHFLPYEDQWKYLSNINKISESNIHTLISKLCLGSELGSLKIDTEDNPKPWTNSRPAVVKSDFPAQINLVKANMLYIEKQGISQRALNLIKRMAAFRNPDFYKAQAMRMPTFNKPRIISCSEETEQYLAIPRGCESDLADLLNRYDVQALWTAQTNSGKPIKVEFSGTLREEQLEAITELLKYDDGVLAATTAFGKTVVAAKLIAERKVNTLILVHRQQLLTQWLSRLSEFLLIDEELPVIEQKRGRKKKLEIIGSLGAGKDRLSSIVDVAIMQSLNSAGEVRDCVQNYGMIIVDECHHIPAFSFEQILKKSNARYIYGLTATPSRQDGHHPIIFMYCGPVRFRVDAKEQAEKRPFDHFVIPRFTGFRAAQDSSDKNLSIQGLYSALVEDEIRNQLIVEDVISCYEAGRHCLVLTERTAHVDVLAKMLSVRIPDVVALKGGLGVKETTELFKQVSATAEDKQITIVATGRFIGEGFDESRLDTLFLAMPISWKGTLQQYAGRLHRLSDNKKEVRIYDYVDVRVRMLEKMYNKRLNGYAAIGYQAKGDGTEIDSSQLIYDKSSFFAVYSQDLQWAKKTILIVSPFITLNRVAQLLQILQEPLARKIEITIVTRPADDFTGRFKTSLEQGITELSKAGITLVFKSKIHQKFAIIDSRIVWYGSINLLSFGHSEESMMRLVSGNIALELVDGLAIEAKSISAN